MLAYWVLASDSGFRAADPSSPNEPKPQIRTYLVAIVLALAILPTLVFAWAAPPLPNAGVCRIGLGVEPRPGLLVGVSSTHIYLLEDPSDPAASPGSLGVFALSSVEEYYISNEKGLKGLAGCSEAV